VVVIAGLKMMIIGFEVLNCGDCEEGILSSGI
jgi:hypothetical protein